jgi:hypothetical protein
MISDKFLPLDSPLNSKLNISDVILKKKKYSSQKIVDDITSRNVDVDTGVNNTNSDLTFNFITDDFNENILDIKEETNDIFIKLLLCCTNYSSSAEDEDIDTLIKNIQTEIRDFDSEIQEIRSKKNVHLSNIPAGYKFDDDDAKTIEDINSFLDKYKGYNTTF